MRSKVGDDDDHRTVLAGGRTAKPSKRRLTPPSDSGKQPKRTSNNTLVGEANRSCLSDVVNETLSHTDAGKQHNYLDQISGSEDEVVCLDSLDISEEEDCSEDDFCVKCCKGGNLLVCSDSTCPISVHKKCMNCPASFDRRGKFYCPLCSCRIAQKKAALAGTYLSRFVAKRIADDGLQEQSPKRVRMEKPSPSTPKDGLDCVEINGESVQIKKYQDEKRHNCCTTGVSPHIGVAACEIAARTDNVPCRFADHARRDDGHRHRAEIVQQIHEETLVGAKDGLDCDETGNKNVQIKKDQQEDRVEDCSTTNVSPHMGAEESEIAARADNVPCRSADHARPDDGQQHATETVQKIQKETLVGAEDALDCDEIRNHNVQIKKGRQEQREKDCCTISISPCIGAESTDNLPCKSADHAKPDDDHRHRAGTIQQIHEETLIACGSDDQGAYREEAGHSREDLPDGQTVLEEHPTIVIDDSQNDIMFQNEQKIGHSSLDGVHEATRLGEVLIVTDSEMENRETVKERGEVLQGHEEGSTRLSKGGDSMQQDQERASVFNERNRDAPHSPTHDCPTQKTTNLISEEIKIAARKSAGYIGSRSRPTCKIRNRKLAWTAEEEKKLKEGVEKFSCTVKKNVPWRKILDFGRGVFECSRNSDDLKDKWRTMTRKRSSGIECDLTDHVDPATHQ